MPKEIFTFNPPSIELRKGGQVVGKTDRLYDVTGPSVRFDEVQVQGDLSGDLHYNGKKLRVKRVDTAVGLLVDEKGPRGPVWQGVECEVVV